MNKICDLTGHETLRLWKCFGLSDKQRKAKRIQSINDMKSASYSGFSNFIR